MTPNARFARQDPIHNISMRLFGINWFACLTRVAPSEVAKRLQTEGGNCFAIRVKRGI